MVDRVEMI